MTIREKVVRDIMQKELCVADEYAFRTTDQILALVKGEVLKCIDENIDVQMNAKDEELLILKLSNLFGGE